MTIDEYLKLISFPNDVLVHCDELIKIHSVWSDNEWLMLDKLFSKQHIDELSNKMLEDIYSNHSIIGEDALGNYILIDNKSKHVVYWDESYSYSVHNPSSILDEYEEYDDSQMNAFNVITLTKSLADLLDHLSIK